MCVDTHTEGRGCERFDLRVYEIKKRFEGGEKENWAMSWALIEWRPVQQWGWQKISHARKRFSIEFRKLFGFWNNPPEIFSRWYGWPHPISQRYNPHSWITINRKYNVWRTCEVYNCVCVCVVFIFLLRENSWVAFVFPDSTRWKSLQRSPRKPWALLGGPYFLLRTICHTAAKAF